MNGKYDQVIDQYVPEGVALTDVQQSYLKAVVELYTKQKTVKMIDVAHHLNKSTGAVSSAMKTLSSKGVLETNSAGDIELLKKGTGQGGSNKATKTGVEKKTVSSSKSTKKASGNNKNIEVVTLYDSITFEMPHEYVLERDGNERCVFYLNEREDETGTLIYDYLYTLTVENFKNLKKGDNPVKLIQDSGLFKEWTEVSLKPYAALALENISNFIDKRVFYSLAYIASLSKSEVLIVRGKAIWDKNDQSYNLDQYNHFIDLINTIKSNGQSVPSVKMTAPVLLEKIHPVQTGNAEDTTELDSQQQIEKWGVGRKDPYVKSVENAGEKLEFPLKVGKTTVTGIADKFEVKGNIHDPRKLIEEVIIPEGYLYIGERAFSDFSNLKKITLPSSLTCIGESAFQGCKNLESITIPGSVKKIGEWAFAYCKALKSIEIEDGVEVIDSAAFYECEKLTEVVIPQSVISIKSSVFHDCLRLKNITIPESTQLDCSSTFKGCKKLADKSGMVIIHNILYDYIGQEDAVIIPQGVTDIGSSAFHSNKTLKSITIPDSVTTIGPCAFQWCSSLREIIIPKGVKTIYHYTFCNCLSLKSIVIPEGVTKVGENAFSGCSMLKTIDLPKSVQVVGSCAFSSQYSPTSNMTIIARNPNIEMHKKCFEGCKKYTIYAPEGSSVSQIFPSRTKPLQEYDNK